MTPRTARSLRIATITIAAAASPFVALAAYGAYLDATDEPTSGKHCEVGGNRCMYIASTDPTRQPTQQTIRPILTR